MIGLGIIGLVKADFTPIWGGVSRGFPAHVALAYLCAVVSLVSGTCLIWKPTSLFASQLLLIYLLAWFLAFRLPYVFMKPAALDTWWSCGDNFLMIACAWVLYVWFADGKGSRRFSFARGDKGLRIARVFYGLALIPFGIAHFIYINRTASLVPGWLPGHMVWAYITGCTFIAAGLAVLTDINAKLAARLSFLQLGLFTIIVWIPIILAKPTAFDWIEFIDSWALTAAAWVVANSYRVRQRSQ